MSCRKSLEGNEISRRLAGLEANLDSMLRGVHEAKDFIALVSLLIRTVSHFAQNFGHCIRIVCFVNRRRRRMFRWSRLIVEHRMFYGKYYAWWIHFGGEIRNNFCTICAIMLYQRFKNIYAFIVFSSDFLAMTFNLLIGSSCKCGVENDKGDKRLSEFQYEQLLFKK